MAAALHQFRRADRPRTRIKDTCVILTAPFADWLRPGNQPVPVTTAARGHHSNKRPTASTTTTGQPGAPKVGAASPNNTGPKTVVDMMRDNRPLETWDPDLNLSHIEHVVLNNLRTAHPQAYEYLMAKAFQRSEDEDIFGGLFKQ